MSFDFKVQTGGWCLRAFSRMPCSQLRGHEWGDEQEGADNLDDVPRDAQPRGIPIWLSVLRILRLKESQYTLEYSILLKQCGCLQVVVEHRSNEHFLRSCCKNTTVTVGL